MRDHCEWLGNVCGPSNTWLLRCECPSPVPFLCTPVKKLRHWDPRILLGMLIDYVAYGMVPQAWRQHPGIVAYTMQHTILKPSP